MSWDKPAISLVEAPSRDGTHLYSSPL